MKTAESKICGATKRNGSGDPCQHPAGWGTDHVGAGKCKLHGGASTGPKDTSYLEGNDFAKGNSSGGAPEGNTNARVHGGFSDWRTAYKRFEGETKEYVDKLVESGKEVVEAHTGDVPEERRDELLKEYATLTIMKRRAGVDASPGGRGFTVEEEFEIGGETHTREKLNPAHEAEKRIASRKRSIAEELCLWPDSQEAEEEPEEIDTER